LTPGVRRRGGGRLLAAVGKKESQASLFGAERDRTSHKKDVARSSARDGREREAPSAVSPRTKSDENVKEEIILIKVQALCFHLTR